eukprot:scaffold20590_cov107-Isochrysis_galbana.AAC.1
MVVHRHARRIQKSGGNTHEITEPGCIEVVLLHRRALAPVPKREPKGRRGRRDSLCGEQRHFRRLHPRRRSRALNFKKMLKRTGCGE